MTREQNEAREAIEKLQNELVADEVESTALAHMKGVDLSAIAHLKASEKISALRAVTSYVGAKTVDTNSYLGKVMQVKGCVVHTATIGKESKSKVDLETGEKVVDYAEAQRTVLKLEDDTVIGFVSKAAESFAKDFLIPLFGQGDFMEDGKPVIVPITLTQISTKRGRTFNFQIV